jgi:hypothetical protein
MSVQKYNSHTRVNNEIIPYTQINTYVIQNIDNIEAGFVWVYLQSKPETWDVIKEHIKKKYKLGNGKIKSIFSYLVKHRLIKNNPIRTEDGKKISHHDIIVLNGEQFIKDISKEKLSTDEMSTGSIINPVDYQPASFQPTINNRYTNKEKIKDKNKREKPSLVSHGFPKDFMPDKEKPLPVDKFTKATFTFTHEEMAEALERDIDIQKVFNKFVDYKPIFKLKDWQDWFKREKNGKKAKNKHLDNQLHTHEQLKKAECGQRYGATQ